MFIFVLIFFLKIAPKAVGPGSYIGKKSSGSHDRTAMSNNLYFGVDQRFKMDEKKAVQPGPGFYSDQNKWNKRTYNLKFLNFQAHAFNNTISTTNRASPFGKQQNQGQMFDNQVPNDQFNGGGQHMRAQSFDNKNLGKTL